MGADHYQLEFFFVESVSQKILNRLNLKFMHIYFAQVTSFLGTDIWTFEYQVYLLIKYFFLILIKLFNSLFKGSGLNNFHQPLPKFVFRIFTMLQFGKAYEYFLN